jgi:hypothetical protein
MRILFVHGRSQGGKNPQALKQTWINTLKAGFKANNSTLPGNIGIDFPFYGDELDKFTAQAALPTPDDVVLKGSGPNKEFEQFMQAALADIKTARNISDEQILKFAGPTDAQARDIQNWGWVRGIAKFIDDYLTDTSDFTIAAFLQDVYLYVNSPKVTAGINKIVTDMLTEDPTIIIGHSLGTVVGYKIILENINKINLVKYITVGSPLGIRAISSKLGVAENPARLGWFNAFDKRDIVALHPLDHDHFPAEPAIDNYSEVDNDTDNRHGIIGYLNNSSVAKEVAAAIMSELSSTPP